MRNCLILLFTLLIGSPSIAQEVRVDRYVTSKTNSLPEQRFPLISVKSITLPLALISNSEAVDFVLRGTGYKQASSLVRTTHDIALMKKTIPATNRSFNNTTILEMLTGIAGVGFVPVIDPVNRLVAFEVSDGY